MIYLMRHGADPSDRYGGWSAYGLTEEGREQVHNANSCLYSKGITARYMSSDLIRALETAEIVANALSLEIIYLPQVSVESDNGLSSLALLDNQKLLRNASEYIGMHLIGQKHGQRVKALSNRCRIQCAWYDFKMQQIGIKQRLLVSIVHNEHYIVFENRIRIYRIKKCTVQIKYAEIVRIDI